MLFFKDSKEEENIQNHFNELKNEFISDVSYKIREPLNSVCGIAEIVTRNIKEDGNKEQLLMYMGILQDAARELQQVVNESLMGSEKIFEKEEENATPKSTFDILNNVRILVAEDSNVNQMIVKELFEGYGSRVTICDNGKEAYDKFMGSIPGTFDVILMDIKMPVMDGYETTDRIRTSKHPQAKEIPIIAMTAEVLPEDIDMAIKAGMNAHVAKPFEIAKIVSAIEGVL